MTFFHLKRYTGIEVYIIRHTPNLFTGQLKCIEFALDICVQLCDSVLITEIWKKKWLTCSVFVFKKESTYC